MQGKGREAQVHPLEIGIQAAVQRGQFSVMTGSVRRGTGARTRVSPTVPSPLALRSPPCRRAPAEGARGGPWGRWPMSGARAADCEAAGKGVCARAPDWLRGARGRRAQRRARTQLQVWGALRWRAAPGLPSLRSPPPARAPRLSGTSFACRLGSRVCARGGDGAGAWEGAGARGPCLSAARAGPAPPFPAPPPLSRARARGEQRGRPGS